MLRLRCADAAVVLHVTSLHVANLSAQTSQRCCTRAPASVGGVRRCRRCRGGVEAVSRRYRGGVEAVSRRCRGGVEAVSRQWQ